MTITCPACNARFRDPPVEVSKQRPFQCGKCDHEWVQTLVTTNRIKMDAPSMTPEMAHLMDDANAIKTAMPVVMPVSSDNNPKPLYVDRSIERKQSRSMRPFIQMAAMGCIALFAGTVVFKDAIMAELPNTISYYQTAGLASQTPGLEIANVTTIKSSKDGISQLIIKGEVLNIADNTVPVPPLKLIMRGEKNANLFAWTVTTAKQTLKAGEKSRFTAVAHDFPTGTVNVEVEFLKSAKTPADK